MKESKKKANTAGDTVFAYSMFIMEVISFIIFTLMGPAMVFIFITVAFSPISELWMKIGVIVAAAPFTILYSCGLATMVYEIKRFINPYEYKKVRK